MTTIPKIPNIMSPFSTLKQRAINYLYEEIDTYCAESQFGIRQLNRLLFSSANRLVNSPEKLGETRQELQKYEFRLAQNKTPFENTIEALRKEILDKESQLVGEMSNILGCPIVILTLIDQYVEPST